MHRLLISCTLPLLFSHSGYAIVAAELETVVRLTNPRAIDQDDMCFWVHPAQREMSTVITSDKDANALFVYSLNGELLQTIEVGQPGNVDSRQGVSLRGKPRDIVVVNERAGGRLAVFFVDPTTRQLRRVDQQDIRTGENYGGGLHVSGNPTKLFFISTSKESGVEVLQLEETEEGKVRGAVANRWSLGMCEGAVSDDQDGQIYVNVEQEGVFRFSSVRDTEGKQIIRLGENDVLGDLEGAAIYRTETAGPFLVVSDQGASRFCVFDVGMNHRFLGSLNNQDAQETDGIDLILGPFGDQFPTGIFACHSNRDGGKTLLLSDAQPFLTIASAGREAPRVEGKPSR